MEAWTMSFETQFDLDGFAWFERGISKKSEKEIFNLILVIQVGFINSASAISDVWMAGRRYSR